MNNEQSNLTVVETAELQWLLNLLDSGFGALGRLRVCSVFLGSGFGALGRLRTCSVLSVVTVQHAHIN